MNHYLPALILAIASCGWAQEFTPPPGSAPTKAASTKRLASDADYPLDLAKYKLQLPRTESAELFRLLTSRNTVYFKLPQVWQHYVPASTFEIHNKTSGEVAQYTTKPVYGIYYATFNPDVHANANFPWETTVGLNATFKKGESSIYGTINFINLPGEEGRPCPILALAEYPVKWIFPAGTTVGEMIFVEYKGVRYFQEIRTRTKSADSTTWEPGLYRPIRDRKEFEQRTRLYGYHAYRKFFHFRNPQEDEVFRMQGTVELLPPLPDKTVIDLLSQPFKEVAIGGEVWSPAADQDFHILPKDYCFALLGGVDQQTCESCHRQTQISVRHLVPHDRDVVEKPTTIGNIRGCDGVFSWHPFSSGCIRSSDQEKYIPPFVRQYDLDNGIVRIADKRMAYGDMYRMTYFVQTSLRNYELPSRQFLHTDVGGVAVSAALLGGK